MKVNLGGIVPLSTLDWTGIAAAVIFMRGCPLRCPYCHNRHLQSGESFEDLSSIKKEIDEAAPFITAIVLSGGEPLVQLKASRQIAQFAKEIGLKVGLETCGYFPDRLADLLAEGLVDKVFLDIKEALRDPEYSNATGRKDIAHRIRESLERCLESGVPLEVRTTVFPNTKNVPNMPSPSLEGLMEIGILLAKANIMSFTLQQGLPRDREDFEPIPIKMLVDISNKIKDFCGINVNIKNSPMPFQSAPYQTKLPQICQLRQQNRSCHSCEPEISKKCTQLKITPDLFENG